MPTLKITKLVVAALLACSLVSPALAATLRRIPAAALKAEMVANGSYNVTLGDTAYALVPGSQVRDTNNRIVLPAALSGTFVVRVLFNFNGQISRIWILTAEERAQPAPTL